MPISVARASVWSTTAQCGTQLTVDNRDAPKGALTILERNKMYNEFYKEGYDAFWNCFQGETPYEDDKDKQNEWIRGYYEAQGDVFTGNY
jgi:hypothetical protein